MGKNVLVLGSGGREHAIIWKLSQSPNIGGIFAAPGNAGIRELADVVPCLVFDDLLRAISQNNIDLVVIGPENLLLKDVAGDLRAIGVPVFGPSAARALIGMVFKVFNPVFKALRDETGEGFIGCLYPQFIPPYIVEFNARFGDPETEVYMRLLDSDLLELLYVCATGKLKEIPAPRWLPGYAVSVAIATDGYPDRGPERQERIYGIEEAERVEGVVVFHGSTEKHDGHVYALGGRALHITAIGDPLEKAIA